METIFQSLVAGAPVLMTHFAATLAVFIVAIGAYIMITPHKEIALIRQGNSAAAVSLGGAFIGLALPLAFCLANSVNAYDIMIWGSFILALQIAVFFVIDFILKGVSASIEKNMIAPAIFLVSVKLSVACITAALVAG